MKNVLPDPSSKLGHAPFTASLFLAWEKVFEKRFTSSSFGILNLMVTILKIFPGFSTFFPDSAIVASQFHWLLFLIDSFNWFFHIIGEIFDLSRLVIVETRMNTWKLLDERSQARIETSGVILRNRAVLTRFFYNK